MSTIEHAIEGTITAPGSDAQAIIDHVNATATPRELEPGRIYLVTDADGEQRIVDTDTYADAPRHYNRQVTVLDADSLAAYVLTQDNQWDGVEVWSNSGPDGLHPAITALLDGSLRRVHTAQVEFRPTPEWTAWTKINGQLLTQVQFAEFVEDHVDQITTPDGATMLELAQSIRAKKSSNFQSDQRLSSGQVQLMYTENIDAKAGRAGKIEIPDELTLALRPYMGARTYKVTAKFRYRLSEGALALGVKLMQPERITEAVLTDALTTLHEALPDDVLFVNGTRS